jgi:Uma2 family endonuclease
MPNPASDAPTIVVEFVSHGKRDYERDYILKRAEYSEIGIAEYWIIDRFRRQLTVMRQGVRSGDEEVVDEGEVYTTPLLPGFELPLAQLLALADRVQPDD